MPRLEFLRNLPKPCPTKARETRANLTLKREVDKEENLSHKQQCHRAEQHQRATRPPRLHPAVERVGKLRIAARNFSAPNFQKFTQPLHRLRAVRPKQTEPE